MGNLIRSGLITLADPVGDTYVNTVVNVFDHFADVVGAAATDVDDLARSASGRLEGDLEHVGCRG